MTKIKTKPALKNTGKKTSRFWSKSEVKKLVAIVKENSSVTDGLKEAAEYFGVSPMAATVKYYSALKGIRDKREDRDTTKDYKYKKQEPRTYKKRKYTTKTAVADKLGVATGGKMTLKIKNVDLDLSKGLIHLEF